MNKNFLRIVFLFAFMLAGNVFSQWTAQGSFPDTTNDKTWQTGNVHGLAVDPDGKVWAQNFYAQSRDSVLFNFYPAPSWQKVRALYVYNPDGSLYTFPSGVENPILFFHVGSLANITDTLGAYTYVKSDTMRLDTRTGRGMRADADGNVVASYYGTLYKFDYKTGLGLGKVNHLTGTGGVGSIGAPAFASINNHMFTGNVVGGNPIREWDANFAEVGVAVPLSKGYHRAFEVSPDGNTIYWAGYSIAAITVYHRAGEFFGFDSVGTIAKGFHMESCAWDPLHPTWLWMSAGGTEEPNGFKEPGDTVALPTFYRRMVWYAWDVSDNTIKDSLEWLTPKDVMNQKPRGISFTKDGKTAYVSVFGWGFRDAMQKFTRGAVGVEKLGNTVPTAYMLAQNYPNPFNPETNIRFSVPQESFVTVKVFNTLGEEVATLVNEVKIAGTYNASFNAKNLTSGIYFYTIKANDFTSTKKMILLR